MPPKQGERIYMVRKTQLSSDLVCGSVVVAKVTPKLVHVPRCEEFGYVKVLPIDSRFNYTEGEAWQMYIEQCEEVVALKRQQLHRAEDRLTLACNKRDGYLSGLRNARNERGNRSA